MIINKIAGLALATIISAGAFAQNSAVTNASMSIKAAKSALQAEDFDKAAKELGEAAGFIEPATSHEKTMGSEKTWRYRGDIYQLISRHLDKEAFKAIDASPVQKAAESYKKALEVDKKGSYNKENNFGLQVMQGLAVNSGINSFNASDFAGAFSMFEQGAMIAETRGLVDTTAIFNAALSADRSEDHANAIKYYQKAIDANYSDPNLYKFIYDAYSRSGDEEGAMKALNSGLEKDPENLGLLIDLVNIQLDKGDKQGAMTTLEKTIEKDPENPTLLYSVGTVYDDVGKGMEAREAYKKAIAIDGTYFDAHYNLGASHYNEAVEMIKECNDIPPAQTTKFDQCKASSIAVFEKAMPHLEKAHELNSTDQATIASLVEICVRTNKLDRAKEYRALIK